MEFGSFVSALPKLDEFTSVDKVVIFAWYLHYHKKRDIFGSSELRACFLQAHYEPPDFSVYLPRMAAKRPPQLVKLKNGYRLVGALMRRLSAKYATSPSIVTVSELLSTLPDKVPNSAERIFLKEALNCYQIKAYRAAIVMAWNLACDHFYEWIVTDKARLAAFNQAFIGRYPKKQPLAAREELEELKESEIIELARTAKFLSKNTATILSEKLRKRNMAAHPSSVLIEQHQADDVISDLVNNVVLKLR